MANPHFAALDGWEPDGVEPDPSVHELDGWILSRLQTLVGTVNPGMGFGLGSPPDPARRAGHVLLTHPEAKAISVATDSSD